MELPPVRGMKRVWVRSLKLCSPDSIDINKPCLPAADADQISKLTFKDRIT